MHVLDKMSSSYKDKIIFAEHSEKVDGDTVKLVLETVFDILDERKKYVDHRISKVVISAEGEELTSEILDRYYTIDDAISDFNDYIFGKLSDDFHIVDGGTKNRPVFGENVYLNFIVVKGTSHSRVFGEKEIYELRQVKGDTTKSIYKSIVNSVGECRTIAEFLSSYNFDAIWKEAGE